MAHSKTAKKPAKARRPSEATETKANALATVDRRGEERRKGDRRQKNVPVAVERRALQRREKVSRRRQIDPTTCERDYSNDEIEFMNALDEYKRRSGRMFPTCSEVLEVIRSLGYVKGATTEMAPQVLTDVPAVSDAAPTTAAT